MLVNRRTLRIEWGQCDPAGIVFYPQYLIMFDTSTGWLFERTGLKPLAMRKKYGIVGMPIVDVGARFVMPCRFDDEVVVGMTTLLLSIINTLIIECRQYPHRNSMPAAF